MLPIPQDDFLERRASKRRGLSRPSALKQHKLTNRSNATPQQGSKFASGAT